MPIRKLPVTFDQHLGAVVDSAARPFGGREFLAGLSDWSLGTVERRVTGRTEFTVKELELVASALNMSASEIIGRALRNFSGADERAGIDKLMEEEGVKPVSDTPASLDAHRAKKKKPSDMTEEELHGYKGESAANTDPEIGHDEPENP